MAAWKRPLATCDKLAQRTIAKVRSISTSSKDPRMAAMVSDNVSSGAEPPIVFRYAPALLAIMVLGIPIAVGVSILFPCVAIHLLSRPPQSRLLPGMS